MEVFSIYIIPYVQNKEPSCVVQLHRLTNEKAVNSDSSMLHMFSSRLMALMTKKIPMYALQNMSLSLSDSIWLEFGEHGYPFSLL